MRVNRILVSIIAVALMGLAPASVSSASAAPAAAAEKSATAASSARANVTVGARICRRDQAGCPGRGQSLVMYGIVTPRTGPASIQRCTTRPGASGKCRSTWRTVRKVNVNKIKGSNRGRYASPVSAPARGSWYWRVAVPGGAKSDIWRTFRS